MDNNIDYSQIGDNGQNNVTQNPVDMNTQQDSVDIKKDQQEQSQSFQQQQEPIGLIDEDAQVSNPLEGLSLSVDDGQNILNMSDDQFEQLEKQQLEQQQQVVTQQSVVNNQDNLQQQQNQEVVNQQQNQNIQQQDTNQNQQVDFTNFYNTITQDFNANGKTYKITDPNDVIRLMQMGLNYDKKMRNIKGHLGTLRMLQENNISPETLQMLIDISKGDSQAIAKLINDKNIDVLELPDTENLQYIPKTQIVSDSYAEFTSTIENVKQSFQTGNQLINDIGQNWDDASINQLASKPDDLYRLANDKQSGKYDHIMSIIEYDRAIGKLPEELVKKVSLLDLYSFVSDQIDKAEKQHQQQNVVNNQMPVQQPVNQSIQQNVNGNRIIGTNLQQHTGYRQQTIAPASAQITRPNGSIQQQNQNPLADVMDVLSMSDEQYNAMFPGRGAR